MNSIQCRLADGERDQRLYRCGIGKAGTTEIRVELECIISSRMQAKEA
jgi:hypothetical protein